VALTPAVEQWRSQGEYAEFRDRQIFVHRRGGDGPLLLLLHGFPTCCFDWRGVLDRTSGPALTFDFLGFGLSDKPADHVYTLAWQADIVEELVRRHAGGREIVLVAHDMGTSVTTELLARDLEGKLSFKPAKVLLFNGSMILDRATLTLGQKLLRGRLGPLVSKRASKRVFKWQLGGVFSESHPLSDADADDLWSLQTFNDGQKIGHRLVYYLGERERFIERWHGAIRDWPGDLSLTWGLKDPVANTNVLAGLRELRPGVAVTELPQLAHYPQVEDPDAISAVIEPLLVDP
jgi:pimeloyl-ACP methyl ester carboxylesterase